MQPKINKFKKKCGKPRDNTNHYCAKREKSEAKRTLRGRYGTGPGNIILAKKMEIILTVNVERSEQIEETF